MQDFNFDEKPVSGFTPIDAGVYEFKLETEIKKDKNNKDYLKIAFIVRDDIEQKNCGRRVFENIYKNNVYRETATNKRIKKDDYNKLSDAEKQKYTVKQEYDQYKIGMLVYAQDVDQKIKDENGNEKDNPDFQTSFPGGIDEIAQFLNGMPVNAKVLKPYDDSTGEEKNQIDFRTVKRTTVHLPENEVQKQAIQQMDISDNDLPF